MRAKAARRAAVPVSGIIRAGGRPGLGERDIRDNWGPLGLRFTQIIN